tara:strand:+ start:3785 stop:5002 length:1218 start_codon:yes stop_codon:yes gene_type:complete
MNDIIAYIPKLGFPDAVIDYNGNDGLIAGIWGFDEIIEFKNNKIFLNEKLVHGIPLKVLQSTLNNWSDSNNVISAVGYIGYDFKNILFPHIKFKNDENNIPNFWFGKPKIVKIVDNFSNYKPLKNISITKIFDRISKKEYFKSIKKIKQYLEIGDVYQINRTYPINYKLKGNVFDLYTYMNWRIKPRRGFYLNIKTKQFLSFSPEEFIKVKNNIISTFPMKGTRPEGSNEIEKMKNINELSDSVKDKAEHLMIVDLLRNDLGKICEFGSVKTKKLFSIQTYETVHHMVTEVYGKLNSDSTFFKIMKALFPGGSITGAPKEKAMQIIDEIENYNRGIYTGTMGYIKPNGDMDFNIAIRTMTIQNNIIEYPVGGGIVWDSNPENEWEETKTKAKILDFVLNKLEEVC